MNIVAIWPLIGRASWQRPPNSSETVLVVGASAKADAWAGSESGRLVEPLIATDRDDLDQPEKPRDGG